MSEDTTSTAAGRQYAAAYTVHYAAKHLHEALGLYRVVMAAYPNTQEAEYSRTQIENIVKSVVPREDLLAAQVELALARLAHEGQPDAESISLTPPASELPR